MGSSKAGKGKKKEELSDHAFTLRRRLHEALSLGIRFLLSSKQTHLFLKKFSALWSYINEIMWLSDQKLRFCYRGCFQIERQLELDK